ncbi:MAG: hypothetical protein M3O93_02595, partial [Chloroflexota bacterium]|nr:hypothetical protein [Chloroflexota bacterium]
GDADDEEGEDADLQSALKPGEFGCWLRSDHEFEEAGLEEAWPPSAKWDSAGVAMHRVSPAQLGFKELEPGSTRCHAWHDAHQ